MNDISNTIFMIIILTAGGFIAYPLAKNLYLVIKHWSLVDATIKREIERRKKIQSDVAAIHEKFIRGYK